MDSSWFHFIFLLYKVFTFLIILHWGTEEKSSFSSFSSFCQAFPTMEIVNFFKWYLTLIKVYKTSSPMWLELLNRKVINTKHYQSGYDIQHLESFKENFLSYRSEWMCWAEFPRILNHLAWTLSQVILFLMEISVWRNLVNHYDDF